MTAAQTPDDVPLAEVLPLLILTLVIILGSVATGVYEGLERPRPQALAILEQLTMWLAVWAWFSSYAARHQVALVFDLGWFFLGLWVLLVPYFLFKTQRWRALIPIGAYLCLLLVSGGLGALVRAAVSRQ